jgi:hypothetical protein
MYISKKLIGLIVFLIVLNENSCLLETIGIILIVT